MSGQRLDAGEHGDIHYRVKDTGRVAATVYLRNAQGVRKRMEATGDSKAAARRLLLKKIEEAVEAGGAGYTRQTTFRDISVDWLRSLETSWRPDGARHARCRSTATSSNGTCCRASARCG